MTKKGDVYYRAYLNSSGVQYDEHEVAEVCDRGVFVWSTPMVRGRTVRMMSVATRRRWCGNNEGHAFAFSTKAGAIRGLIARRQEQANAVMRKYDQHMREILRLEVALKEERRDDAA